MRTMETLCPTALDTPGSHKIELMETQDVQIKKVLPSGMQKDADCSQGCRTLYLCDKVD